MRSIFTRCCIKRHENDATFSVKNVTKFSPSLRFSDVSRRAVSKILFIASCGDGKLSVLLLQRRTEVIQQEF